MTLDTPDPPLSNPLDQLIGQMETLRQAIENQARPGLMKMPDLSPGRKLSAENLLHYLALRSVDIRPLQDRLTRLGLSSLGRVEPHVMATINAVLHNLYILSGRQPEVDASGDVYAAFDRYTDRLEQNTVKLFGEQPKNRRARIMVTMPAEAADDYMLVHQLVSSGMNCMRINCVQGNPETWLRMIGNVRDAERALATTCRVLMDLGGPKLRLGPMEPGPAVLRIRPVRAGNGQVLRAARIWLTPAIGLTSNLTAADANLILEADWLSGIEAGDRIRFRDARGSSRKWLITEVTTDGCWAEAKKTCYLVNGTVLSLCDGQDTRIRKTQVAGLAPEERVCVIRTGDVLLMSAEEEMGRPAIHDGNGELLNPGRVLMTTPEVYRDTRQGEPIFFDDGRISGVIEKCEPCTLQIRITHTRKPIEKLQGNRGVNLPDTRLDLPALGKKDLKDIEFAARHADMIGLSFANSPADVRALYQRLVELGREDMGVVLKIETKRGFANLPAMLLEALKFPVCGVMIARGDLAVECGFERLSEVQEEILWVCESAHVPVIWATQVLEGLTKHGHVSRAEITDAAMAQAAEAVMLNKGPQIVEAVEMLDNILQRMQNHRRKKRSMLRKLHVASEFQTIARTS